MRHWKRNPAHHSDGNIWQRWALNIGAVLGSLCLLVAVSTLIFGLKPLIFASGSMWPGIPTGSLGLAVPIPVSEVVPGQVVSVVTSDGTRVTHRVVENRPDGLILKGDANSTVDLQPYQVVNADRLLLSVPVLGYVMSWFSQPWAFFVGGLMCAYLLYLAFFRRNAGRRPRDGSSDGTADRSANVAKTVRDGKTPQKRTPPSTWMGIGAAVTALAVVISLGTVVRAETTQAAFSAQAEAHTAVSTAVMPFPATFKCAQTADVQAVTMSWTPPGASPVAVTGYRVTVSIADKSNSEVVKASTSSLPLTMKTRDGLLGSVLGLLEDLLSLLIPYERPVEVSLVALYPNGWESAPTTHVGMLAVNKGLLLGGKRLTC